MNPPNQAAANRGPVGRNMPLAAAARPTVTNIGQVISVSDEAAVHAPQAVAGDYVAQQILHAAQEVSWPVRVGIVPQLADRFQPRPGVQARLDEQLAADGTAVLRQFEGATTVPPAGAGGRTQVLSGLGGNGKTQLAAAHARRLWNTGELDLLAWVTAASMDSILSGYLATARAIGLSVDGLDADQAAAALFAWCETTDRRWLFVLDDLTDPTDLTAFWPSGPAGRVLVTTRRHDTILTTRGRQVIDVGLFTPDEAHAYLTAKLETAKHTTANVGTDQHDNAPDVDALALDLGHLPLALAQAAAVITQYGWTCAQYRQRFADQRRRLVDLLPADATADDYATGPHAATRATIATTWSLSITAADRLRPTGLASQLLQIAAFLDPNGIPTTVLTSAVITEESHTSTSGDTTGTQQTDEPPLEEDDIRAGLGNLARLSLADLDAPPARAINIRVHALVQRAVRDTLAPAIFREMARTAASLVLAAWPEDDYRPERAPIAATLRSNTTALNGVAVDVLWQPAPHQLLLRAGRSLRDAGQHNVALEYQRDLLTEAEARLGHDNLYTVGSRNDLGYAYLAAGHLPEALALLEAAVAEFERLLGPDHANTLAARNNLAGAYRAAGRYADALPLYETALAGLQRALGADHPETLNTRNNVAFAYRDAGRLNAALAMFEVNLVDRERILGPEHPDLLNSRNNLAGAYQDAGRIHDAIPLFQANLGARERLQGADHPDTLNSRNNLATAYFHAGLIDDALPLLTATHATRDRVLGPDHPDTLLSGDNLATAYYHAARLEDALPLFEATLAARERVLGPEHPDTLTSRNNLAAVYMAVGRHADALPLFQATLTARERVLGPDHPDTMASRVALDAAR